MYADQTSFGTQPFGAAGAYATSSTPCLFYVGNNDTEPQHFDIQELDEENMDEVMTHSLYNGRHRTSTRGLRRMFRCLRGLRLARGNPTHQLGTFRDLRGLRSVPGPVA